MRTDRFQPNGPVRDPPPRDPPPRDWWRFAREAIPVVGFVGGLVAYAGGYITTNATGAADSRYAAKELAEFRTATDNRLKEAWARMDQIDRDRESRNVVINKSISDLGETLRGQIDGVRATLNQRWEARTAELNDIKRQLDNQQLKVCVLSGLRVSQCK